MCFNSHRYLHLSLFYSTWSKNIKTKNISYKRYQLKNIAATKHIRHKMHSLQKVLATKDISYKRYQLQNISATKQISYKMSAAKCIGSCKF